MAFDSLDQRGALDFATQLLDPFEPALDVTVEFLTMIPVVCERRMDLPEGKIRMLEMHLVGTPTIGLLLDNQLDDLRRRGGDCWDVVLVQFNMFVACFHVNLRIPR